MTTKFAVFFLLTFRYSEGTFKFLLLIFTGSAIESVFMPSLTFSLGLMGFCCFADVDIIGPVVESKLVMVTDTSPASSRTFEVLRFEDNIVWAWL